MNFAVLIATILSNLSRRDVLLESAQESSLLLLGLVTTVTELGGGINPLELNLLKRPAGGMDEHGLAESHDTLLDTRTRTLDQDEVVVDDTIADPSTHWSDLLLGNIELSRSVTGVVTLANSVDLVVDGSTMMVTVLTGTSDRPLNVGRMPGTDTSNLAETLVSLARKLLGTPTGGDTGETVTLGDSDNVDHLVLLENRVDSNFLLEQSLGEVDLVGNGATVDLDFHQVGLLLLEGSLADLRVDQNADNSAVLLDALEFAGDRSLIAFGVLLSVPGESLLLALVPVLIEAALDLLAQMLSPDGSQRAETAGSLDVTNNTNADHGRSLNDSDSLNNLLLVHLGTGTVEIADNGGHASLVSEGGSEVNRLLGVILGE